MPNKLVYRESYKNYCLGLYQNGEIFEAKAYPRLGNATHGFEFEGVAYDTKSFLMVDDHKDPLHAIQHLKRVIDAEEDLRVPAYKDSVMSNAEHEDEYDC